MANKDCIILAGGMGTRLQSVVADTPKCLADLNRKPFLSYLCAHISKFNFRKVVFSIGYKKEMIIDYITKHPDEFPFEYSFAEEDEPLGTGGAILNAISHCETEDVFVMNGDTFFDVDFDAMLAFQQSKMADCTLALKPMEHADRYGLVKINEDMIVTGFEEKKPNASGLINGGIYCIFRSSFINIPFERKFSFEKEYLEKFITERNLAGFIQDTYFIDIGIPEDYEKAKRDPAFNEQTNEL